MSEAKKDESDLSGLLCVDTIDMVADNSDENGQRARVYFKNGHELSIIRGSFSYGGDEGLFEIMPSDESFLDDEDGGDQVAGYLTADRVQHYINKIGNMAT